MNEQAIQTSDPPVSILPDRPEIMNFFDGAPSLEIEAGVVLRTLVGAHNHARELTTGLVTFFPGASLPYHTHPHAESVTLLEGRAAVEVEGRRYLLLPLENIYIPPERAHMVMNLASGQRAVFHLAMPTSSPSRKRVEQSFPGRLMAEDDTGFPGGERVNRLATTPEFELAPEALFRNYFNSALGCPEMSGGYGLFAPGARLPCHLHDFDESICIVQGRARCVVEGRRFTLSDYATALVPRGRCHFFVNETQQPMAMIWVYAGPMPDRIVLAECWCSGEKQRSPTGTSQ